jgi:cytochrome c biogenesis protein CcmG, thiol:disulfide interchange protein DsbE
MPGARRRTPLLASAAAALVASVLAACGATTGTDTVSGGPTPAAGAVRGQLVTLRAQANTLLDGGPAAFRARLASLRGKPVVVNQWASWCGPCRFEFPFFQRLAKRYAGRVAFLGVDSQDSRSDAEAFLKKFPVPYPHFYDEDASVARVFRGGRAWPTTAFYGADGTLAYTHIGAYATQQKLDDDIRRYALHG